MTIQKEVSKRNAGKEEEVKLSLFADDMILYLKKPKNSAKKLLGIINSLQQSCRMQNQFTKISNLSMY
jgi:mannose/fructose/N-acetylgalactosamine-specific phosphotransferase system component IIB